MLKCTCAQENILPFRVKRIKPIDRLYTLPQSTLLPLSFSFPGFTVAYVLPDRLPQSQTEWAQLLESQQKYHDSELQKWREIIKSSVMLLDQVRSEGHCVLLQPCLLPP